MTMTHERSLSYHVVNLLQEFHKEALHYLLNSQAQSRAVSVHVVHHRNEQTDATRMADEDRKPSPTATAPPSSTTTTTATATPVKPALKKEHKQPSSEEKHLKWNEVVIAEHDQLRGTRMKIDEPNTPYTHYDSGAESDSSKGERRPKSPAVQKDSISWDTLQNRLDSVKAVQEAFPTSPDQTEDSEHVTEEDDKRREMRKLEFREHRKRHYNEMELVKKFRQEHPEGLVGDEEEGDDADDENEG